jgi:hypothetical protein
LPVGRAFPELSNSELSNEVENDMASQASGSSCALELAVLGLGLTGCVVAPNAPSFSLPDAQATSCPPSALGCLGTDVGRCRADGIGYELVEACDGEGEACSEGRCVSLCEAAVADRSYEGCEFMAVDLDNHNEGAYLAATQQFAVVVSNVSALPARVTFQRGATMDAEVDVAPGGLAVVPLPFCSVDGSESTERDGDEETLAHSATTSCGVRVVSTVPIVAYQFNPLEPVGTFTEDASLLLPTSAWGPRYTVLGWPQTVGPRPPAVGEAVQARAFVAVVASTRSRVQVTLGDSAGYVRGLDGGILGPGDRVEVDLEAGQVLNLETTSLGSDFTGTVVEADAEVGVFSGSECANIPFAFQGSGVVLYGACDHLEEQLLADRTQGRQFVLASLPSRSQAVFDSATGRSTIVPVEEPDLFRVLNVGRTLATVETTLPAPDDRFILAPGEDRRLSIAGEAYVSSDEPLSVMQFLTGQEYVRLAAAGGDPSSLVVAPIDQYRSDYTVFVPEYHAFDFLQLIAQEGARVEIDGESAETTCTSSEVGETGLRVLRCPLSYPEVDVSDPLRWQVERGVQDDGVHRVTSSAPVGVSVYGFDSFKSYAYPGGLRLTILE